MTRNYISVELSWDDESDWDELFKRHAVRWQIPLMAKDVESWVQRLNEYHEDVGAPVLHYPEEGGRYVVDTDMQILESLMYEEFPLLFENIKQEYDKPLIGKCLEIYIETY